EIRILLPVIAASGGTPSLNQGLLTEYIKAFQSAAQQHGLDAKPDLNAALRIPGMFAEAASAEPPPESQETLMAALSEALNELNSSREREGTETAAEMRRHNFDVGSAAEAMERIRQTALTGFQSRLSERLAALLQGAQIDPQRLAQEAAILAD